MYRPLDKKLHHQLKQDTGEYFGKDCGNLSKPRGQGQSTGIIRTAEDAYPCIIPYRDRQTTALNKTYQTPKIGDRPMHETTMTYTPVKPMFTSVTRHEFGGRSELKPHRRVHPCRSMHTSQIIFGNEPKLERTSTYAGSFYDKYSQPHYKVLQPILNNRHTSINSRDMKNSMGPESITSYLSQYGGSHNKLGAMLDISKPKYEIPKPVELPRHYDVLTGKDTGPSWQPINRKISGNRVLYSAFQRDNSFVLC